MSGTPSKIVNRNMKSSMLKTRGNSISLSQSFCNKSKIEHTKSVFEEPTSIRTNKKVSIHYQNNKITKELENLEKEIIANKNKLLECVKIYEMLANKLEGPRCLIHNNSLSLYCLNERIILCVNCLYGMHKHRSHKVIPLRDCMEHVYKDNSELKEIISEKIIKLDEFCKISEDNLLKVEAEMKKIKAGIDEEFERKIEEIKTKYEETTSSLNKIFNPLVNQCLLVKEALENFRFSVWKAYTMYSGHKETDENEIMKHLLFVYVSELSNIQNKQIKNSELDLIARKFKLIF